MISRNATAFSAVVAILLGAGFLLRHLIPAIDDKPIHQDEALGGLVAARPLLEVLDTVLWDRGGAPLHFVLAHAALALDPSPASLRWLSVVFALATIPLCYDLGRRLAGPVAGMTAGVVAATSTMLGIYGSFGRMYALFAFAGALAADLFVRALDERTARAAALAAAVAWLLPAVHPYGILTLAAEAAVALALWRGRPVRPALPVAALGLAALPFAMADVRLADRFGAEVGPERGVVTVEGAARYLANALRAFAGGEGWTFAVLLAVGLAGLLALARSRPAFAAFVCLAVVAPLGVLVLASTEQGASKLFTRHMIFALPLWAAAIGAGVARAVRGLGPPSRFLAVTAVAAVAVVAPPGGARDPRAAESGRSQQLAAPADWIASEVSERDVLFPYSPVYLAALSATRDAIVLTRAQARLVLRGLERVDFPVRATFAALPLDGTRLREDGFGAQPGRVRAHVFDLWLIVEAEGPFADERAVLAALSESLTAAREAAGGRFRMAGQGLAAICNALESLGETCRAP